jgi:hypothetical protein
VDGASSCCRESGAERETVCNSTDVCVGKTRNTGSRRDERLQRSPTTATTAKKIERVKTRYLRRPLNLAAHKLEHDVRFELRRLTAYYGMRARFFDVAAKLSAAISLLSGTVAYQNIADPNSPMFRVFALGLVCSAILSQVVGLSQRAKDYEILRSKAYGFMRQLEASSVDINMLRNLRSEIHNLYASGPVFLAALDVLAARRACISLGLPHSHLPHLTVWHRFFVHFWSFTYAMSTCGREAIQD